MSVAMIHRCLRSDWPIAYENSAKLRLIRWHRIFVHALTEFSRASIALTRSFSSPVIVAVLYSWKHLLPSSRKLWKHT